MDRNDTPPPDDRQNGNQRQPTQQSEEQKAAAVEAQRRARISKHRDYIAKVTDPAYYGIEPGPLTTPVRIRDAMLGLKAGGANLLGPTVHLDVIPPNYVVSLRFEFIDPYTPELTGMPGKRSNGAWYEQKGGGLSLTYVSLNKLAHLAGLTWIEFGRTDDGRTPLYWRYRGRAKVRLFDGEWIEEEGTGESDLRDGSAEAATVSDKQLAGMRAKGSQRAESICKAAIIRKLLALKASHSWQEAEMPFVWPVLKYIAPTDDAEINRMIAAKELGLIGDLYGPRPGRTVIDVTPTPKALPAPSLPPRDFAAENARLNERQTDDQPMPWDEPDPDDAPPPSPQPPPGNGAWAGYGTSDVVEYCEAKGWGNLTIGSPQQQEWLRTKLAQPQTRTDIDAFLGSAGGAR